MHEDVKDALRHAHWLPGLPEFDVTVDRWPPPDVASDPPSSGYRGQSPDNSNKRGARAGR